MLFRRSIVNTPTATISSNGMAMRNLRFKLVGRNPGLGTYSGRPIRPAPETTSKYRFLASDGAWKTDVIVWNMLRDILAHSLK